MFKTNKLTKLSLSLALGTALSLMGGINLSTRAQNPNDGFQSNEKDATYGDAPAGLNPLDLMHRAQQSNGRNAAEFNAESESQLYNSASDFKRMQQQKILEQQQEQKATQVVEEETVK